LVKGLWWNRHNEPPPFEVDVRFGLPNLRDAFRGFLFGSEIGVLGVITDADASSPDRYAAFYQYLERGYKVSRGPEAASHEAGHGEQDPSA
jgi:hypothetical protein